MLRGSRCLKESGLGREGAVAAQAVDGPPTGRGQQPGAGLGRDAVASPALGRNREGLLGCLLGEIDVAEEADQGRDDLAPLVAEDLLDQRARSTIGRISTEPPMRAAGIRDAIWIAPSRSSASSR